MFLQKALDALAGAAQHPLAIGLYMLVVVSWLLISWRVKRNRNLLEHLKSLPVKDRLKALELEMGPLPKKGLNAEQWLRSREQTFNLARWGIVSLTVIIILSLAVFYYLQATPNALPIAGQVTLDNQPLKNATLNIVGVAGEWKTDQNGSFNFQIPALIKADSLTLSLLYQTEYQPIRQDTTVVKNVATALQWRLHSPAIGLIAGWVKETGTGKPIAGAQIILEAKRGTGQTDTLGYFHFPAHGKPFEGVQATVSHPNYELTPVGLTVSEENQISLRRKK